MKKVLTIIGIIALLAASIFFVVFKDKLEQWTGLNVNSVIVPIATSIISVFAGISLALSKLKSAMTALSDKDEKSSSDYINALKAFADFKKDFDVIKTENAELKIAIDRLASAREKANEAAVMLAVGDNEAVKNGFAAQIAEVLTDE